MTREELIQSLTLLKEQARNSGANTFVWDINIDSFNYVMDSAIQALEQEPTTKDDLGVDCVARQDVERYIEGFINEYTPKEELEFINLELDGLKHIPSVTPQEPRKGKWIPRNSFLLQYKCSECGLESEKYNYCPNCGSRNEVEE